MKHQLCLSTSLVIFGVVLIENKRGDFTVTSLPDYPTN